MNYKDYSLSLWNNRATCFSPEWQVVFCFYAALHATNDYLYQSGKAPQSHTRHQEKLDKIEFVLLPEYEQLRELSEQARYCPDLHPLRPEKIQEAEQLTRAILEHLNII